MKAKPVMTDIMCRIMTTFATLAIGIHQFYRIMVWASSMLLSITDMNECPAISLSFTFFWLCYNSICLYMLHHGKVLYQHCAESLLWISAPDLLLYYKKWVMEHSFSLVYAQNGACHSTNLNLVMMLKHPQVERYLLVCVAENHSTDQKTLNTSVDTFNLASYHQLHVTLYQ